MELSQIKGIGPKTEKTLNKLGIYNGEDLINYYPFRYEILERSNINKIEQDQKVIIDGIIETKPAVFYINRKMDKMSFKLNTGEKLINITIFNRGFLKNKLTPGTDITVIGKYDKKYNTITASDIHFGMLGNKTSIEPIYHTTYGLTSKQIREWIQSTIGTVKIEDLIPEKLSNQYHFISKEEAIKEIHNPKDQTSLKQAQIRLKYEELFLFMTKMQALKKNKKNKIGLKRNVEYQKIEEMIESLPFTLTEDQDKSVKTIYQDLISENRMNRLLQGDVGSGKTIVSFLAIYINYLSGYQSALMAPTEILANQHYKNMTNLFSNTNMKIKLLTGKLKAKEKKEIQEQLKNGTIDVIIGTHALISDDVTYQNLGLVITDEQHRFGVNQRANLKNKGLTPDILYMSATPIPRTYAISIYGDMDISSIRTMPSGRKPVITELKKNTEIRDVLEKMYIELKKNHQIYVIAPLIEESEKIELENVKELENKMNRAFGKLYKIGVLHGKMSAEEKETIMNQFKKNEIQILISTTVIEVGVDVENATMMVIFDSYRFGLSSIHQLRGRVGRSSLQSYCILISDYEKERLKILTETTDGFKISEEDFKLRGSGDLFGVRQSGDMSFKIADLKNDFNIVIKAKEDSERFYNEWKDEIENKHIKDYIEKSIMITE